MFSYFGCLAAQAGPGPVLDVTVHVGPVIKVSCLK